MWTSVNTASSTSASASVVRRRSAFVTTAPSRFASLESASTALTSDRLASVRFGPEKPLPSRWAFVRSAPVVRRSTPVVRRSAL
jgi:hypothetical protein